MTDTALDTLPILVLRNRYVKGSNKDVPDNSTGSDLVPLEEALVTRWSTDAHIAPYRYPNRKNCPRLKKDRAKTEPLRFGSTWIDVDLDSTNPTIPPEGTDKREATQATWEWLCEVRWTPETQPTALYLSKHGFRLVYVHEDLTVYKALGLRKFLNQQLAFLGIATDLRAWKDWTRIMRLPRVRRNNEDLDPPMDLSGPIYQVPSTLTPYQEESFAPALDRGCPDPSDYTLAWDPDLSPSAWGRVAFPQFEITGKGDGLLAWTSPKPRPVPSPRHDTIKRDLGYMLRVVFQDQTLAHSTTPEHLFAFCAPRLAVSDPHNNNGKNLYQDTWDQICSYWPKEEAKFLKAQEQEAEAEAHAESVRTMIPDDFWERLILQVRGQKGYYAIMEAPNYYSKSLPTQAAVLSTLRRSPILNEIKQPMRWLCRMGGRNLDRVVERKIQDILGEHMLTVDGPVAFDHKQTNPHGVFDPVKETLTFSSYYLNRTLTPEFNGQVDKWLGKMFGPMRDKVCLWVAGALEFGRPICALSLCGDPGSGKGLFVQGLVDCTAPYQEPATKDVFTGWQYDMEKTPWIHVNEGLPDKAESLADKLRIFVAGDLFRSNRKFQGLVSIKNPFRVIFTTNHRDIPSEFYRAAKTKRDRDALTQRLAHVDVLAGGASFLHDSGGWEFTKHWATNAKTSDNRFVLAKHFLSVHQNLKGKLSEDRFAVSGVGFTDTDTLLKIMLANDNELSTFIRAVLRMRSEHQARANEAIKIDSEGFWILPGLIADYMNTDRTVTSIAECKSLVRKIATGETRGEWRKIMLPALNYYLSMIGQEPITLPEGEA